MKRLPVRQEAEAGSSWPAIAIGAFVAFGGLLFGYDTGTISGILAMDYWREEFSTGYRDAKGHLDVSPTDTSAVVSILSAGTFFGALASPLLGDNIGRRWGLIVSCWIFNFGVVLQTAASQLPLFLAGRFFAGLGVGLISALVPLYQSETAPKWIRGAIVGAYQFAITIGLLLAAVLDNATHEREDSGSYRIPIALQFAWSLILIIGMLILPETPRYLIKKNKMDKAAVSLGKLRRLPKDHPAVVAELSDVKDCHDFEMSVGKASYLDLFRGNMLKRQLTGMGVQALQQLTGINFIFYYGTQYFLNSGISNPFTITMITSCINVISTIPGLYAIDAWGRRPLLLWGAIGMCFSQLLVAILGTTTTGQDSDGNILVFNLPAQKASIAFVCIYIFFFASTWGPLAWVVTGEIFPLKTRARGLSVTTATNWLFNWAIAYATPYLVNYGPGKYANLQSKIFFVWFAACFLCIAFVYFFVYETKGLSLEEVDEMYNQTSPKVVPWRSKGWVPSGSRGDALPGSPGEKSTLSSEGGAPIPVQRSIPSPVPVPVLGPGQKITREMLERPGRAGRTVFIEEESDHE
ncbi:general substrate transporter [Cercophora samala]|uniref:General substrate transporter n=1 Tax=Cercophora samala TaxID=330535 RepID=A0AA39Z6Z2_9PEZI|nr:general substrate transporter [Cercophora samala]